MPGAHGADYFADARQMAATAARRYRNRLRQPANVEDYRARPPTCSRHCPLDGGLEVELVGEVARMVEPASSPDNKNTAPGGAAASVDAVLFRRSVNLVSGTRNRLKLLLAGLCS